MDYRYLPEVMIIATNISNKLVYTFITIFILTITGLIAYATYNNIPNPGHGADQISVILGGQEKTLQEAIDTLNSKSDISNCKFHLKPITAGDGGRGGEGASGSVTYDSVLLMGSNGHDYMFEVKICYNCGSGEICETNSTKIYLYESD